MTTFRARFDGQVLIPERPLDLPQGSVVEIRATVVESPTSALQALTKLAADFPDNPDLPADGAAQHDHYLYQTPKRP
ncbi:MAG TPA: antitoxin family protein [Pirellulales bacterium]|nr:antitoxin family protein [Pirellulales bacterium]